MGVGVFLLALFVVYACFCMQVSNTIYDPQIPEELSTCWMLGEGLTIWAASLKLLNQFEWKPTNNNLI